MGCLPGRLAGRRRRPMQFTGWTQHHLALPQQKVSRIAREDHSRQKPDRFRPRSLFPSDGLYYRAGEGSRVDRVADGQVVPAMKFRLPMATSLIVAGIWFGMCRVATAAESAGPADSANSSIDLEALSRLKNIDLEANPAVKAVVMKLLEQLRGKPEFVDIVGDFKIPGQETALLEFAAKAPNSAPSVEAIRIVLKDNNQDLLKESLAGTNAIALVQTLGNTGEKAIVPILEPLVVDESRDVAARREVVRALSKVRDGALVLLDLAKNQKLPDELLLTASTELNSVHWE